VNVACVDSAYLDPLRHDYRADLAFLGACVICGAPEDWHREGDNVKQMPPTTDPRGPMTAERVYGMHGVPKIPEGMKAELMVVEDGDWYFNYQGKLRQKSPTEVIFGPRLCVVQEGEKDGEVDVQGKEATSNVPVRGA
jgi:hypothetical protein